MHFYLINGTVKRAHNKAMGIHVEDQILAHDGQPNESNVGFSDFKEIIISIVFDLNRLFILLGHFIV